VVGVSRYAKRPPEVAEKPRVCAFVKADLGAIEAVEPDLVLAFSDLQADIAAACVRRGLPVVVFNQRSVSEILGAALVVGGLVGREEEAKALVDDLRAHVRDVAERARALPRRPRVHAEEWDDPLITGIRWVAEVVEIAGGDYLFPEKAEASLARDRVADPAEVARRDPEVVLASWCGKRVDLGAIARRPGWDATSAVRRGRVFEVDPAILLQPGPAVLTDGLDEVHARIAAAVA
jgi:iron complex transport system substrate-binding protein